MSRIFLSLATFFFGWAIAWTTMQGPSTTAEVNEQEAWTLTAMHRLYTALDAYRAEHGEFPFAGPEPVGAETLRPELEPEFIETLPAEDGWRAGLSYWSDGRRAVLISPGPDGETAAGYGGLPRVGDPGDDLVLIDGRLRYGPEHVVQLLETSSQKRTMADIRSIATCFEAYKLDNDALPGAPTAGWVEVETITELLQPVYIRRLPVEDGWGNPFWVWSDGESYRIVSDGSDGRRDADWTVAEPTGGTSGFERDIVMGDGQFLQWPEGPQS